jgi:hypothetical protein
MTSGESSSMVWSRLARSFSFLAASSRRCVPAGPAAASPAPAQRYRRVSEAVALAREERRSSL